MTDVQIDLGEVRAEPQHALPHGGRPPVPYRALLAALAAVLVTLLAGADHPSPVRRTIVPARLGDDTVATDDRLFVIGFDPLVTPSPAAGRVITSYHLPDGRMLDRTTVAAPGAIDRVFPAGRTLLVTYQLASGVQVVVAVALGTNRQLWQRSGALIATSPADGLVLLADPTDYLAVDAATGALRWAAPRPVKGGTAVAGLNGQYPRWLVTVTDSGRLQTRDARTGQRLATSSAVAAGGPNALFAPTQDLVVVGHDTGGSDAYRLPDLSLVWHSSVDLSQTWMQSACGPVICASGYQRGIVALDPATGRRLWQSDRSGFATAVGRFLLVTEGGQGSGPQLWVLDPLTGRPLGDFGAWQGLGLAGDGTAYGMLNVGGDSHRILYGVLDPATRHARVLGAGDQVSGGCETAAGMLICRLVDASIALWRLR